MKKIFALITAPVVLLLIMVTASPDQAASTASEPTPVLLTNAQMEPSHYDSKPVKSKPKASEKIWYDATENETPADMIDYALSLIGSPYVYGGISSTGFDCSGFTFHVFEEYGTPITRSSTTQSQDGVSVDRQDARPGDLVIFTGTNLNVREPGHVGIVISQPGDTISFVHSSSNGGVKVSQVEGTRYDDRFLDVRRVL